MLPKPEEADACRGKKCGEKNNWGGGTKSRVKGGKGSRRSRRLQSPSTAHPRKGACSAPASCFWQAPGLFFSFSDMGTSLLHHLLPSPFLSPLHFPFSSRYFHHISTLFHPHLPSLPPFLLDPLLSCCLFLPLHLHPSHFVSQLPEELSNDLNETPAFFIVSSPPCWIPKRTQPHTAIRKRVPGAAAFAMSAWRFSLPSPKEEEVSIKLRAPPTRGQRLLQSLRKAFLSQPGPFPSLPVLHPPSGCQHIPAPQQHDAFHVLHGTYSPPEPSLRATPRARNIQQPQRAPGRARSGWGTISVHTQPGFRLRTK